MYNVLWLCLRGCVWGVYLLGLMLNFVASYLGLGIYIFILLTSYG